MGRYSRGLGDTLAGRLAELQSEKPQQRHSLEEEVDVARAIAERALSTFDQVCVREADKASAAAKSLTIQMARDAMTHVSDVVLKAAKVRAISREVVDVELLGWLTREVEKILTRRFENGAVPRDVVDGILEEMRAIELPERTSSKAGRAEAQQIVAALAEMDVTVPREGDAA